MMKKVLVIGGGASGLMAAIAAARQGAKVKRTVQFYEPEPGAFFLQK